MRIVVELNRQFVELFQIAPEDADDFDQGLEGVPICWWFVWDSARQTHQVRVWPKPQPYMVLHELKDFDLSTDYRRDIAA